MTTALLHRVDLSPATELMPAARATGVPARATTDTAQPIEFALIDTPGAFETLEGEWNGLMERAGRPIHVFQTFAWNWHWTRHYLDRSGRRGPRLAVVTGRIGGTLALVVPLVVERAAGLKQLAWMGDPVTQYGDAVAAPEAARPEQIAAAIRIAATQIGADVLNLRKVRADSLAAPALALLGARIIASEEAPFMRLDASPDYATYEAGRSPKRRKNRARHMRRLQERGTVEFGMHAATKDAADLAAYAILIKRATLKAKGQVSPSLADPRFSAFFAGIAEARERPVGCRVMTLRSGGEMAAMQIVLDHSASRFLHVSVFTAKFEKCGVGGLLLEYALKDCFEYGISTFDLLAPKHEYKMDFADGTVAVHDHAMALSAAGRLYTGTFLGAREKIKRAIEGMPAPVRRAVDGAMALLRR